jgi:hypothetical protein
MSLSAAKAGGTAVGFAGSRRIAEDAQDYILGYSQPSLRDWSVISNPTQDSRPGLLSVVPTGLDPEPAAFT